MALSPSPIAEAVSPYWLDVCCRLLGTDARLARKLWATYDHVFPHRMAALAYTCAAATLRPSHQSRLIPLQVVSPQTLFQLTLHLSPERQSRPRRPEIVALEERILSYTDRHGQWKRS